MQTQKKGFGIIEWLIIGGILVVIGALVYVAVAPKSSKTAEKVEVTSTATPATIEEVKADQKAIEAEDGSDVDKDLDALTSDLENL